MEYGGTRCTGPTWTKFVPKRPTWTNLAKLVVVLLCFAFLKKHLSPTWTKLVQYSSYSIPCAPDRVQNLVAFHPRPQIASDLGRNFTRNFNPHRNRNQFPSGNEILAYGRRLKSQPASTRCDLRIASPTRPFLQVI